MGNSLDISTNKNGIFIMKPAVERYEIFVGGKTYYINADASIEPCLNDLLRNTLGFLRQSVYTPLLITECFIHSIEENLKKKSFFKFGVKKKWNECVANLTTTLKDYENFAPEGSFDEAFAFSLYDITANDIKNLRDVIANKLSPSYGNKAGSYANVCVMFNLLTYSVLSYSSVMEMVYEQSQINFTKIYKAYSGISALEASHQFMEQVMGRDIDTVCNFLETKAVKKAFEKVRIKLCGQDAFEKASKLANKEVTGVAEMGQTWSVEELLKPHYLRERAAV